MARYSSALFLAAALLLTAHSVQSLEIMAMLEPGTGVTDSIGYGYFNATTEEGSATFEVKVADINNVILAHIHMGPIPGPVVVPLFAGGPISFGPEEDVLVAGTITPADFTGPLAGYSFADFVDAAASGMYYVNVHTTKYPAGEINGYTE